MPTPEIANNVIRNRLALLDLHGVDWQKVGAASRGLSHTEVTIAAEQAAKDIILTDNTLITTDLLIEALQSRTSSRSKISD